MTQIDDTQLASALNQARTESTDDALKATRKILTPEERKARDEARAKEREDKKAAREARKAAQPPRKPAHMAKVEKAASRLPRLSDEAAKVVDDAINNFGISGAQAIVAHIQHHIRVLQTLKAVDTKLEIGQVVRIKTHQDPKNIGLLGRVTEVRRIRSHVQVLGADRRVYIFNSDVEQVTEAEAINAAATAGFAAVDSQNVG